MPDYRLVHAGYGGEVVLQEFMAGRGLAHALAALPGPISALAVETVRVKSQGGERRQHFIFASDGGDLAVLVKVDAAAAGPVGAGGGAFQRKIERFKCPEAIISPFSRTTRAASSR